MKQFRVFAFVLLVTFMFGLVGCAGTANVPETEEATEAPEVEMTDEVTAEPTEAVEETEEFSGEPLLIWAMALYGDAITEIGQDFEEIYGIPVEVVPLAKGDLDSQVVLAAPNGEGPDLFLSGHSALGKYFEAGIVKTVDLGDQFNDFQQSALEAFAYDGEIYGIPVSSGNVGLFRNVDLVPEAPETIEDLETICQDLKDQGVEYPIIYQSGDYYGFVGLQYAFGGYVFGQNEDGSYNPEDVGMDDEGSLAAIQWLSDMIDNGCISKDTNWDTSGNLFGNGEGGMYITGSWDISRFKELGVNYEISAIPAGVEPSQPWLAVNGFYMNAFSENTLSAEAFLSYMATEEPMQKLHDLLGENVPFLTVQANMTNPDTLALVEAGKNGNPVPNISEMGSFWGVAYNTLTLVMQQDEDPVAAFQNAAQQIRDAISGSAE